MSRYPVGILKERNITIELCFEWKNYQMKNPPSYYIGFTRRRGK